MMVKEYEQVAKSTHEKDALLTTAEAAAYLSVTSSILTNWRCTKRVKIRYLRIGHAVRYRKSDLDEFLEAQTVEG